MGPHVVPRRRDGTSRICDFYRVSGEQLVEGKKELVIAILDSLARLWRWDSPQGGRAGGEVICGFFPYNTRPFTPPSDNLYFRFLRRIAPGLPGVGNRPRWPTRAACLIVLVQLLSWSSEFRSLACSRTVKREKSEGPSKRGADVGCGSMRPEDRR